VVLTVAAAATGSWALLNSPAAVAQVTPRTTGRAVDRPTANPDRNITGDRVADGWALEWTLVAHERPVWCVAFSPDGKLLATGAGGTADNPGELILWDATSGKVRARSATEKSVRAVAFSPDGKTLATAEFDNAARLWDSAAGKARAVLPHDDGVYAVAFSPDGTLLATACWDKRVRLWSVADQGPKVVRELAGHADEVYSVAFSPDGRWLASAAGDGVVRLWDLPTGKELRSLKAHDGVVEYVAFSPDGKLLASAGWDKVVRLWDAQTGKEVALLRGHTQQALCVAFSPDGRVLASSSGRWGDRKYEPGPGEVILWDLASGRMLATLKGHTDRVFGVAFSPDGTRLATASWDGTVKLWLVSRRVPAAGGPIRGEGTPGNVERPPSGRRPGRADEPVADRLDQLVNALLRDSRTDEQVIEALYLAVLGRLPTDGEKGRFAPLQQGRRGRQEACEALVAALCASPEFQAHLESLQRRSGGGERRPGAGRSPAGTPDAPPGRR
jgi:WD40 repeat protein